MPFRAWGFKSPLRHHTDQGSGPGQRLFRIRRSSAADFATIAPSRLGVRTSNRSPASSTMSGSARRTACVAPGAWTTRPFPVSTLPCGSFRERSTSSRPQDAVAVKRFRVDDPAPPEPLCVQLASIDESAHLYVRGRCIDAVCRPSPNMTSALVSGSAVPLVVSGGSPPFGRSSSSRRHRRAQRV